MTLGVPSLGRKLLLRLVGVFALAFVASCALYLVLAWRHPSVEVDLGLGDLADRLAARVSPGADGKPSLNLDAKLAKRLVEPGMRYVVIDRSTGRVLGQSQPSITELIPMPPQGASRRMAFSVSRPTTEATSRLDGFVAIRDTSAGPVLTAVAQEHVTLWQSVAWAVDELKEDVVPIGVPLAIVTLLVTAMTIRRTLKPVAKLSRQAEAITPRTIGLRLDAAKVPAEVLPLVTAFNAALDRLDQGFMIQRRFTANAAHQLRTPLAILRARLDGMGDGTETATLKRDCDRIARVVSQLLSIARLDAHQIEIGETVDLCVLARETVADMAPLAIRDGRVLALDCGAAPVAARGNSAALREALGNLIDNALRFSPASGTVEIAVRPGASLSVLDRGPGVPEHERARMFEPFWRGRDARGPGSGLGLAIVAEIAEAHGGRVQALARAGGGAEFRIELPETAAPAQRSAGALAAAQ